MGLVLGSKLDLVIQLRRAKQGLSVLSWEPGKGFVQVGMKMMVNRNARRGAVCLLALEISKKEENPTLGVADSALSQRRCGTRVPGPVPQVVG